MKRKYLLIVALLVVVLACVVIFRPSMWLSLGHIADDKSAAMDAINVFHTRLSNKQYDLIYRDFAPELKRTDSKEHLIATIAEARRQFGRVTEVTHSKLNVIVGAPVQVRVVCNTTFGNGKAVEFFTYLRKENGMQLAMYKILSGTGRF